MNDYLDLLVPFLTDWDSALCQSQAQYYSCMGPSHAIKNFTSCWIIHFACYTCVYEPIFTCDDALFSRNISLCDILSQATYRPWWKHIDPFCPTVSCFPFSSLFPLQWPSSTPCQTVSLTSALAKSIWEHLVRHWHPSALGFPDPWCPCLA